VIDACCGVGGSAIGFARAGCEVVAIEPDPERLAMARHNAALYGVSKRILFLRGRAEDLLGQQSGDLVFLDPPWGVDWDRRCALPSSVPLLQPLRDLCSEQLPDAEVWAKVPPSFDTQQTPGASARAVFGAAEGDRRRVKFLLLRWAAGWSAAPG